MQALPEGLRARAGTPGKPDTFCKGFSERPFFSAAWFHQCVYVYLRVYTEQACQGRIAGSLLLKCLSAGIMQPGPRCTLANPQRRTAQWECLGFHQQSAQMHTKGATYGVHGVAPVSTHAGAVIPAWMGRCRPAADIAAEACAFMNAILWKVCTARRGSAQWC